METRADFAPRDRLHATGAIIFQASLDLDGPSLLYAFVRLLDAFEKQSRKFGTVFRRKSRCLLIELLNRSGHEGNCTPKEAPAAPAGKVRARIRQGSESRDHRVDRCPMAEGGGKGPIALRRRCRSWWNRPGDALALMPEKGATVASNLGIVPGERCDDPGKSSIDGAALQHRRWKKHQWSCRPPASLPEKRRIDAGKSSIDAAALQHRRWKKHQWSCRPPASLPEKRRIDAGKSSIDGARCSIDGGKSTNGRSGLCHRFRTIGASVKKVASTPSAFAIAAECAGINPGTFCRGLWTIRQVRPVCNAIVLSYESRERSGSRSRGGGVRSAPDSLHQPVQRKHEHGERERYDDRQEDRDHGQ